MASPVLVVGTTSDYIDLIRRRWPGRALFVTDRAERAAAWEEAPRRSEEVLADLVDPDRTIAEVKAFLSASHTAPAGVACFDCESLELSSKLAFALDLPFPPEEAIAASRSKYLSKRLWEQVRIPCPQTVTVRDKGGLEAVFSRMGGPVVIKPLTGAGSELVFRCGDLRAAEAALLIIHGELSAHPNQRMYRRETADATGLDPRLDVAVEEFVEGTEFSCDFVLEDGAARLIRVAAKVLDTRAAPGTTLAYLVPGRDLVGIPPHRLAGQFGEAARTLGFDSGLFMVDFIVRSGEALLLEMTPRPSGDCLPWLIARSSGIDTIGLALDYAEGKPLHIEPRDGWERMVGLRLFARRAGTVRAMDTSELWRDPRVVEVYLKRRAGHRVVLPPEDYDSRVLGHVIYRPSRGRDLAEECMEIEGMFALGIEEDR